VDTDDRLVIPGDSPNSIILSRVAASNGYARMPPIGSNIVDPEGITLLTEWINDYANARPRFGDIVSPFNVLENSLAATNVGEPLGASDPDSPSSERGNLSYSIINGNTAGFFEIDPISGQLTLSRDDLDFEEATSHQLTVKVTDAFTANPGVSTASFTVNVLDLLNDDSQGDGIADEWAVQWFSTSTIDPTADFDGDGFVELLEYWADSDPTDASELGLVLEPTGEVSTPGSEGFFFEWNIRSELIIGGDYIVQGSSTLDFVDLSLATDFELISSTPVNASLSRIKIKIPTEEDKYFLRLRSPN